MSWRRFGKTFRPRQVSLAVRKRSTTYFDFLDRLDDDGLREEYIKVYSHRHDINRKAILNQFLLERGKLDIIR